MYMQSVPDPITIPTQDSPRGILHSGAAQPVRSSENTTQCRALQNCNSKKALWLMKAWSGGISVTFGCWYFKKILHVICAVFIRPQCLPGLWVNPTSVRHCNISVTDVQISNSGNKSSSAISFKNHQQNLLCIPGLLNNKQSSYRIL